MMPRDSRNPVALGHASKWLALLTCLVAMSPCYAQSPANQNMVKAAVVFKLTKFVEWPASAFEDERSSLNVCAAVELPMADALKMVDGRTSKGRSLRFVNLNYRTPASVCHVLFLDAQSSESTHTKLTAKHATNTLTVSEAKGFANSVGIVEISQRNGRLGFRINLRNAEKAGISMSAPLLQLSEVVE